MEEIKINMENLTQEEREQPLKLEERGQKPVEREWPQEGDEYFVSDSDGTGLIEHYTWRDDKFDHYHWQIGDCFRTKEEAEWYREHLKVCAELRRMADGKVEYGAWCDLSYYFCEDHILVCTQSDGIGNPYTFASTLRARRAIDTIGEERLKKYWFRVED